jgi:hypothetical protein
LERFTESNLERKGSPNGYEKRAAPNRRIDLTHPFLPLYAYEAQVRVPCLKNGLGFFRKLKHREPQGPPLSIPRRSPLQGRHSFDCIGCRIAHPAGNRLIVEAPHVLQSEFASGMSARIFSMTR